MSQSGTSFKSQIQRLHHHARDSFQRRLVVLSGSRAWCCHRVIAALEVCAVIDDHPTYHLWVGDEPDLPSYTDTITCIPASKAGQWLGRETHCLVIDGWSGFDADAFGALSGTLQAGGLLLLLTPPLAQWSQHFDPEHKRVVVYPETSETVSGRYLKRLTRIIGQSTLLSRFEEHGNVFIQPETDTSVLPFNVQHGMGCKTADQLAAVTAIRKVAQGHRKRPLVLTADRGRGKSAALGIAAASLMKEVNCRIIVTAPSLSALDVVFEHAALHLENPNIRRGVITWQQSALVFKAPDELTGNQEPCQLLFVDEAAAIPATLLQKLLASYSRIVFSSTIHGYEGTGQGFAVRFRKSLDQQTPQWRSLHCKDSIRWSENDPVEQFTFRALMLNAEPVSASVLNTLDMQHWVCEKLNRDQLLDDDLLLNELFGLLILAHYKTRPFDLRQLLDGTNIQVYTLRAQGHVLATALMALEGNIDKALEESIWRGERRVRGHLLPQSLSNHVGIAQSIGLTGARVIRIAVHPAVQRQGLGAALMDYIRKDLNNKGVDYMGSLFGATPELLTFWRSVGLQPVRVGLTREASSGTHSALLISAINAAGERLVCKARQRFSSQFVHLLADGLRHLDADIVIACLPGLVTANDRPSEAEIRDLTAYTQGQRLYESTIAAIKPFVLYALSRDNRLNAMDQKLLVSKVLQGRSWDESATYSSLSGKKEADRQLRSVLAALKPLWVINSEKNMTIFYRKE